MFGLSKDCFRLIAVIDANKLDRQLSTQSRQSKEQNAATFSGLLKPYERGTDASLLYRTLRRCRCGCYG